VTEEVDSVLDGVLLKQTFKNAGVLSVKLGDNVVEYNKRFVLFLTSKLRNPHYSPDTSTKVSLVNFSIT
jgi:dynein heavy chain